MIDAIMKTDEADTLDALWTELESKGEQDGK
jgi:hypothetical protein